MTVREAVEEVYEGLGRLTQLDPYDPDTGNFDIGRPESQLVLRWLNAALQRVSHYKLRDGTLVRFRGSETEQFFQTQVVEADVASATFRTVSLDLGPIEHVDGRYRGWVLRITEGAGSGQMRYITGYQGNNWTATVHKGWDVEPDATSKVSLHKRFMLFESEGELATENLPIDPTTVYSVLKVTDLDGAYDLDDGGRTDNFSGFMLQIGEPRAFFHYAGGIVFDVAADSPRSYRAEILQNFGRMTVAEDRVPVPEPWDQAVIMWALWWGHKWNQEVDDAFSMKRDVQEFMEMTAQEHELMFERTDGAIYIPRV
jgi:hypothetical protein